jgi:hypothetical protein
MKAKPLRKRSGIRRPLKRAPKRAKGFKTQIIGVTRPSPIEFSGGVDDEEALVVGESLDEREKRG